MKTIINNKVSLRKLNDKEILDDDEITTYLLGKIKYYQNIIFETNSSFHVK